MEDCVAASFSAAEEASPSNRGRESSDMNKNERGSGAWSKKISSLKAETSEPKELSSLNHLEELFRAFALTVDLENVEEGQGIFKEIANSFDECSLLGVEIRSRAKVRDMYLPYLSALHVVYKNDSNKDKEGRGSVDGGGSGSSRGNSTPASPRDFSSSSDEEIDSVTGSLSTRCSLDGSVLASWSQSERDGRIKFSEEMPFYLRKSVGERFQDIMSSIRMLDVITAQEIIGDSYLIILWSPVGSFPRVSELPGASRYYTVYDLSNPVKGQGSKVSYPIVAMFSRAFVPRVQKPMKRMTESEILKSELLDHACAKCSAEMLIPDLQRELSYMSPEEKNSRKGCHNNKSNHHHNHHHHHQQQQH